MSDSLTLTPWSERCDDSVWSPPLKSEDASSGRSPFLFDEAINSKIALWKGDSTKLRVGILVNSTSEMLDKQSAESARLHAAAGPGLAEECSSLGNCRTGEVKITKGYSLPARFVAHTVGPRFNTKYKTAAESALFNCYRGVLYAMSEQQVTTLALTAINSTRRGYPPEGAAHIASRAVRRFLEKHGKDVDRIVFCVDGDDMKVYHEVLPMYFPRTLSEEAWARINLPGDIGNEDGEPVIEERKIRIGDQPIIGSGGGTDTEEGGAESDAEEEGEDRWAEAGVFAGMEGDHDQARAQQLATQTSESDEAAVVRQYQRWLKRARSEDLSGIAALNLMRTDGVDVHGRRIISLIGRNFPAKTVDVEKALCYFINIMDSIVHKDYVIVYYHTESTSANRPDSSLFKQLYDIVDSRYKDNLRTVYVVHPTFWSKAFMWIFATFSLGDTSRKIENVTMLRDLFSRDLFDPDQLDIPDYVVEYDKRINKSTYSRQPNISDGSKNLDQGL